MFLLHDFMTIKDNLILSLLPISVTGTNSRVRRGNRNEFAGDRNKFAGQGPINSRSVNQEEKPSVTDDKAI